MPVTRTAIDLCVVDAIACLYIGTLISMRTV